MRYTLLWGIAILGAAGSVLRFLGQVILALVRVSLFFVILVLAGLMRFVAFLLQLTNWKDKL